MINILKKFYNNIIHLNKCIKRFFYYGWKLKKSGDWDSNYLYEVMLIKITELEKSILNDKYHFWKKKEFKQIKTAKNCLKRIIDDNYFNYSGIVYEERKDNEIFPKIKNRELFLKRIKEEKYLYKQDMELFCKIFKKYSRKWWT